MEQENTSTQAENTTEQTGSVQDAQEPQPQPEEQQAPETSTPEATESPEPELVVLPHTVDIEVEDGISRVYCASTGRRFSGWGKIKPNLEKQTVTLSVTVFFEAIRTVKAPPKPKEGPVKDERQIELFPEPATTATEDETPPASVVKFIDDNASVWFYTNEALYIEAILDDGEHVVLENVSEEEAVQYIKESSGRDIADRVQMQ